MRRLVISDDWGDRGSVLAQPRPVWCDVCPAARKDHTFPMLDACAAKRAQRRGFRPWMVATLGAIGEAVPK